MDFVPDATSVSITDVKDKVAVKTDTAPEDQMQIHENDPRTSPKTNFIFGGDMAVPLLAVQNNTALIEHHGGRPPTLEELQSLLQMPNHHPKFQLLHQAVRDHLNQPLIRPSRGSNSRFKILKGGAGGV